jgi:hypothetical protein
LELAVQQVKLFTGIEDATEELAREINTWIRESGATVLQISGNIAPQSNVGSGASGLAGSISSSGRVSSDLFVIVLYEEK